MRPADLGEFGLIARLTQGIETRPDVLMGVGDDAALLDPGQGALLVVTCDAQVEGRHFIRGIASPAEIGHKALAVNLSDIAAMGAEPLWALVSLLIPPTLDVATLDGIYAGMRALARRFSVAIVGGNVSGTDGPLVIDVTLIGRTQRGRELRRAGAQPGDRLFVTGTLGATAAGVLALVTAPGTGAAIPQATLERARRAMVAPEPRVAAGRALAETGTVTAMVDISDGLTADLGHLCAASGVGAVVEVAAVPVDPDAVRIAGAYKREPLSLALAGGEDYQLLFAAHPDVTAEVQAAVERVNETARDIGFLTEAGTGMRLRLPDGAERPLEPRGWDHLRASGEDEKAGR